VVPVKIPYLIVFINVTVELSGISEQKMAAQQHLMTVGPNPEDISAVPQPGATKQRPNSKTIRAANAQSGEYGGPNLRNDQAQTGRAIIFLCGQN
jgi:hypothetical protein